MDFYFPPTVDKPAPVLMYVHGGEWSSGNRQEIRTMIDLPMFTSAGYIVVAVDYRLAPQYHFPAMIQDVKCAIRYLRAHAEEYNIDPDRIAAWGFSAGGHLVSLLGLADESAGWDVGEYLDQSSRVQAVISMFGLVDLTVLEPDSELMQTLFGVSHVDSADLARASAATYISPDDPPFMIVHGDRDWVIPQAQSVNFDARLDAAGVPSQLLLVKNAGHGFIPMGKPLEPSVHEVLQLMLSFLNQRLNTP
jgi:acetyl esterase/lipase